LALAAVNVTGVRQVANTSNTLAIGKLLPLAIFIVAGLFFLDPSRFSFAVMPGYRPFSQSVLLLVYAFTGFEMAVIPAGESRDPRKNLPSALMLGMTTVVIFYLLIQVVCIGTLPGLAESHRPLADAAARFWGFWGAAMITAGIVISLAGNLNVLILAASRVIFAMAERGELPRKLAVIHAGYRTPVASILVTTTIMLVLTLSGTFIYLLTISILSRLVTYFVTCVALPVLRKRTQAPAAAFLLPAGPVIAVAGIALVLWLLSNSTFREARDTLIAAAAGLGIYWLYRTRAHSA
jgi:basic amino acid/polyamine antiporter, APA family